MVKFGNFTDRFKEGAQAYSDGITSKGNPYRVKSSDWEDWKDGHAFCKSVAYCRMVLTENEKEKTA